MRFKTTEAMEKFEECAEVLRNISVDIDDYMWNKYKKDLYISQTKTTKEIDKSLGRVSDTHSTGRAIDIPRSYYTQEEFKDMLRYAITKWGHLGAIVNDKPKLIEYGNKRHKNHAHLQISRIFAI